jgi:hypothetical protein
MLRTLSVCALLLTLAVPASPQQDTPPTETVIRMTLTPAAAPKPALKYQLLPELREMKPGNPIHGYLVCFSEQSNFFFTKEVNDQRDRWSEMPLKDLPVAQMRGYGGIALRQADYAARLDQPDWQVLLKLQSEGIHLLLPEVQQMRTLAHALQVRFRGEVADRRFDDALVTARTMLAMSRHLGEHPTLIGSLVGIAIAHIAIGPLEEMLQQPGCPNLFWGLTSLPSPLIGVHKAMQGERLLLHTEFARLDEKAPMSQEKLDEAVKRAGELVGLLGLFWRAKVTKEMVESWLEGRAKDEAEVRAARMRLVEFGLSQKAVEKFPPLQVVLLDLRYRFETMRDERMKLMELPYWQTEKVLADSPAKQAQDEKVMAGLLGGLAKVRLAQARLEQRLALLRCVEALRLYAATNEGRLPEQLADTKLPLPVDPITGRPFPYELKGATATLRGSPPPGMEKVAPYNLRFVITIAK